MPLPVVGLFQLHQCLSFMPSNNVSKCVMSSQVDSFSGGVLELAS